MKMRFLLAALTVFVAALCGTSFPAQADIKLNPQRLVFTDRDRTADLNITNSGNGPAVFKLELYYLKQTETGSYVEVPKPADLVFDPDKILVISPKQVRLPPKGQQRVRVSIRRPEKFPDGEYRVHLRLNRVAQPVEAPSGDGTQIMPIMTVNVGFSIPVIIRQGQSDGYASIFDAKLIAATAKVPALLEVTANREGNYSTVGNLKAFWTPPGGKEVQVGTLNNFNIFTENTKRISRVPLTQNNIPNGTLRVIYEGDGPDRGKIFGEKVFPVGG